ncbi:MAG: D-alanyl-D-alanine carboxypeptidase/D-alanyl-D-alanine-endopeptidase [Pseudorhodobacter sp.]
MAGIAVPGCAEAPARSIRPAARAAAVTSSSAAQASSGAAAIVEAARLGGSVGFVVAETQSGKVLEAMGGETPLPPASVAKAMTALYALDRLGPQHRFATRVLATGPVSGGRVQGDLVLIGTGDPTLDTDRLGDLASALAARGIKEITGRFLACGSGIPRLDRIDRDQPDHVGYNPTISGLNLNFNRVHFEWKRGNSGPLLTMDARGRRFVPRVTMAEVRAVNRAAPLFDYRSGAGRDEWTVAASALNSNGSRWLPVRHPEAYCAEVFAVLMRAHGLTLPTAQIIGTPPAGTMLAEIRSDDLQTVSRDMLRFSTNITAEAVGLTASGAGALAESGRRMSDWAAASHGANSRFVDHSGLGAASRIAPADMVRALRSGRGSGLPGILREQAMRDAAGKEMKGHPVKVVAKTGTLNFVSGLAGYIQPPNGRELTFAIFCADLARRDRLSVAERERPEGGPQWTGRARNLQGRLLGRWASLFT